MIKVKALEPGIPGHWYMGADYMVKIGPKSARALCGMHPVPRVGYEYTVAVKNDNLGFSHRLTVQNVSGDFWLTCSNVSRSVWGETFGVNVT